MCTYVRTYLGQTRLKRNRPSRTDAFHLARPERNLERIIHRRIYLFVRITTERLIHGRNRLSWCAVARTYLFVRKYKSSLSLPCLRACVRTYVLTITISIRIIHGRADIILTLVEALKESRQKRLDVKHTQNTGPHFPNLL